MSTCLTHRHNTGIPRVFQQYGGPLVEKVICLFLCVLLLLSVFSGPLMADDSTLTLGIFPRRNAQTSYELFSPLSEYLSTELGRPVSLDVSNDFESFWRKLATGKFDLVHFNQYHYLAAHRDFNFEVVGINQEFGRATLAGSIIVRKDAGFESLADLKGKKIVFGGGPSAMMSYIVATYLLHEAGLASGDYQEEYAINPPNAVLAAFYQQADAAGAGDIALLLNGVTSRIDTSELKYLARSQELPHLPWAVSKVLAPELRFQIRTILTTMDQTETGLSALHAASLDKILPAQDQDFNPFREITLLIKGEQY